MEYFFGEILSWIDVAKEGVMALPISVVVAIFSALGILSVLLKFSTDHTFGKFRVRGVTKSAFDILLNGLLAILILDLLIDSIQATKGDVPLWLTTGLPIVLAVIVVAIVAFNLRRSRKITASRFFSHVVVPVMAPVIPFGIPAMWTFIRYHI